MVRRTFAAHGATTKHAIAGLIVARFPEIAPHRPRFRKPWMSEDGRQATFDAAAFGVAFFGGRTRAPHRWYTLKGSVCSGLQPAPLPKSMTNNP